MAVSTFEKSGDKASTKLLAADDAVNGRTAYMD